MIGRLMFNNRVAIVTGAGGGLGREYALLLASRGASVVVNDLGGAASGEGKSNRAADIVVTEIRSKGGKAVANYDSVENGEAIVKTALDAFGKIDILINNAGILRDKSFMKMTEHDWDLVHKVHLKGSYMVTKAVWEHFRQQKFGRIIMTASNAGLYGNFGQANYSAAKLGLLGLSNSLAVEGAKYNIFCNTIIPVAASRLTQDVLPSDLFEAFKPRYVAPVVAWLCHEDCKENGGIFEAAGGWAGKYLWRRSNGHTFIPQAEMSIEGVRDNWDKITDMSSFSSPLNIHEHIIRLAGSVSGKTDEADQTTKSQESTPKPKGYYRYSPSQAILYALGVGVVYSEENLMYLNEFDTRFSVLPSFGTLPALDIAIDSDVVGKALREKGLTLEPTRLLHGEQYIELYEPIKPEGEVYSKAKLVELLDKGSGALAVIDVESSDAEGKPLFYNQISLFLVGTSVAGAPRHPINQKSLKNIVPVPDREPDATMSEKTQVSQAALYRLSGDRNPLHIDPQFAAVAGFSKPILHGLCTYGYAVRHILEKFADNDTTRVKAIKARFAGVVTPGETIRTDMWRGNNNRIHFRCVNVETGKTVIDGGYVDLVSSDQNSNGSGVPEDDTYLVSDPIFDEIGRRVKMSPDASSKVGAVYQFDITKNDKVVKHWVLDLLNAPGSLYSGEYKKGSPTCTILISDENMAALAMGELDAIKEYMRGVIKIQGNAMATQKLNYLFKLDSSTRHESDYNSKAKL